MLKQTLFYTVSKVKLKVRYSYMMIIKHSAGASLNEPPSPAPNYNNWPSIF